jgi:hypothetical protein
MPHIASITVISILLLAGCAAQPASSGRLKSSAIITSGDTVSYLSADTALGVSVTEIDGKPVASPYGPIDLVPGKHTVTMKCGDTAKTSAVTVAAGEVYQFNKIVTPGVKGCVGSLLRVRSINP